MSTVSGVTSNNDLTGLLNSTSTKHKKGGGKIGEDFDTLQKALTSGDINAAKTAFATLQTDFKNGRPKPPDGDGDDKSAAATSSTGSNSGSSSTDPLQALAAALQSGNISDAQTALTQLQQSGPGHHHHHHQKSTTVADPTGVSGQNVDVQA